MADNTLNPDDPGAVTGDAEISLFSYAILGHLLAQWYAEQNATRLLHFKGPFSTLEFPSRGGGHSDADILVADGQMATITQAMLEQGFTEYNDNSEGVQGHGYVLEHADLPVTVDFHHYFPGLRENWKQAFDALWEDRVASELDTWPKLPVMRKADHALVLMLDTIADRICSWQTRQKRRDAILEALTETEKNQLAERAIELGVPELMEASLDPNATVELTSVKRFLMELQHRPGLRGIGVWGQRIVYAENNRRRVKIIWLALTTPAKDTPGRNNFEKLARHWARGVRQAARTAWLVGTGSRQLLDNKGQVRRDHSKAHSQDGVGQNLQEDSSGEERGMHGCDLAETAQADSQEQQHERADSGSAANSHAESTAGGLLKDTVVWFRTESNEVVAAEINSLKTIQLQSPGAELWGELSRCYDVDEAIANTISYFPDAPTEAPEQLRTLIQTLRDFGFVHSLQKK
ncbi:MAG: nucleotidyltransferase family protein [Actinomycetaceae bacterium]|nr:nucleotidyltransferase family protein [Actinomycetaceae bacterium]